MSGLINKAKEAAKDVLHGDKREDPRSDNSGPHKSSIINKLDPRVDSDKDNRDDPTSRVGGYGDDRTFSQNTGGTGSTVGGGNQYDNPRSDNAGPHGSNLMNKVDPRVDSDRDGRNDPTSRTGGYGQTQDNSYGGVPGGYGQTQDNAYGGAPGGHDNTRTGGLAANTYDRPTGGVGGAQYDDPRSTNTGPHSSNLMNKVDPRIDSDRDGRNDPTSRVGGYGNTQDTYGTTGTGYGDNRTGLAANTHDRTTGGVGGAQFDDPTSRAGGYGQNQPGYGSGGGFADTTTATGAHHGHHGHHGQQQFTPGSGNATGTAGPHDSNLLNKFDPRVDSDLDGSKTYGGDRTNY